MEQVKTDGAAAASTESMRQVLGQAWEVEELCAVVFRAAQNVVMQADVSLTRSDTVRAKWDLERAAVCTLATAVLRGTWLVWRSARPAAKVCAARM